MITTNMNFYVESYNLSLSDLIKRVSLYNSIIITVLHAN